MKEATTINASLDIPAPLHEEEPSTFYSEESPLVREPTASASSVWKIAAVAIAMGLIAVVGASWARNEAFPEATSLAGWSGNFHGWPSTGCSNWNDIELSRSKVNSKSDCAALCAAEATCTSFDWMEKACEPGWPVPHTCLLLKGTCKTTPNKCWELHYPFPKAPFVVTHTITMNSPSPNACAALTASMTAALAAKGITPVTINCKTSRRLEERKLEDIAYVLDWKYTANDQAEADKAYSFAESLAADTGATSAFEALLKDNVAGTVTISSITVTDSPTLTGTVKAEQTLDAASATDAKVEQASDAAPATDTLLGAAAAAGPCTYSKTYKWSTQPVQVDSVNIDQMKQRCTKAGEEFVDDAETATCIVNNNADGYDYDKWTAGMVCPYPVGATETLTQAQCEDLYDKWKALGVKKVTLDGTEVMTGIGHGVLNGLRGECALLTYKGKSAAIFQVDIRGWSLEITKATWEYLLDGASPEGNCFIPDVKMIDCTSVLEAKEVVEAAPEEGAAPAALEWTKIGSNLNYDCHYMPSCFCTKDDVNCDIFPCDKTGTCGPFSCSNFFGEGSGATAFCQCFDTAAETIAKAAGCTEAGGGEDGKMSFGHPMHEGQGCGECVFIKCGDKVFGHMNVDGANGNYEVSPFAYNDGGTGFCTPENRGAAEWAPNPDCKAAP